MDKAQPLGSPMIVWSLKINKIPFCPWEESEKVFGLEVYYFSTIGAIMYLATRVVHGQAWAGCGPDSA